MSDAAAVVPPASGGLGRIGRNFLSVSTGNLISKALGFVAVAYLARLLGPGGYGELSWAQAAFTFALFFSDLGLQTLAIRELGQHPERAAETAGVYLPLKLVLAVVTGALLAAFGLAAGQTPATRLLTVLYALTLPLTSFWIEWVFIGLQRMGFNGLGRIVNYLAYALLLVLLVRRPEQAWLVPLISGAGTLLASAVLLVSFRRLQPGFQLRPARAAWPALLRLALPLGISTIIVLGYSSLPVIMLGWFQNETATGLFSGAYRVFQVIQEVLALFLLALFPVVAHRWKHSPETVGPLLQRVLKLLLALTLPASLGALVVGRPLLLLILGERFALSVPPFQILLLGLALMSLNGIYAQLGLLMSGRQTEYLWAVSVGGIVSVALDLLLIPRLGTTGAALAVVGAEAGVVAVSYWYTRQIVPLRLRGALLRPLAAASLMAWVCWLLLGRGTPVALVIAAGMALYMVALLAIGGVNRQDLELAWSLWPRAAHAA